MANRGQQRRRWTLSDIRALMRDAKAGVSDKVIGNKLGRSPEAVKQQRLKRGVRRRGEGRGRGQRQEWTKQDESRLRKMAAQQMSTAEIARKLGRTPSSVRSRRWELGLEPPRHNPLRTASSLQGATLGMLLDELKRRGYTATLARAGR